MTGGGGERQPASRRNGENESTEDCGYVSRGRPQVGSGGAGPIRVFPLCDWVSH